MTDSNIKLIWQSEHAVAVNKPAGLLTQAPQGIECLETRLRSQLADRSSYLAFPHRLDRAVSGVILVALTKKSARLLSAQFASRKTRKTYLALVEGDFGSEETRWDDYVRKIEGLSQCEVCRESDTGAKLASTTARILHFDVENGCSRLELNPITGRMHQLRLQTSHHGHPILGDRLYGAAKLYGAGNRYGAAKLDGDEKLDGATKQHTTVEDVGGDVADVTRIMLHAHRLGFHAPSNGRWTEVEAPCPF